MRSKNFLVFRRKIKSASKISERGRKIRDFLNFSKTCSKKWKVENGDFLKLLLHAKKWNLSYASQNSICWIEMLVNCRILHFHRRKPLSKALPQTIGGVAQAVYTGNQPLQDGKLPVSEGPNRSFCPSRDREICPTSTGNIAIWDGSRTGNLYRKSQATGVPRGNLYGKLQVRGHRWGSPRAIRGTPNVGNWRKSVGGRGDQIWPKMALRQMKMRYFGPKNVPKSAFCYEKVRFSCFPHFQHRKIFPKMQAFPVTMTTSKMSTENGTRLLDGFPENSCHLSSCIFTFVFGAYLPWPRAAYKLFASCLEAFRRAAAPRFSSSPPLDAGGAFCARAHLQNLRNSVTCGRYELRAAVWWSCVLCCVELVWEH